MLKRDYSSKKYTPPRKNAKEIQPKGKRGLRTTLVVVFVLLLTISVGLSSDVLTTQKIVITGTSDPDVSLVAQQWLSNHTGAAKRLNVFPANHILLIQVNDLRDALLQFNFISDVGFVRKPPETIEIVITERKPNIVYHQDNVFTVVGENGAVIGQSHELSRFDLPLVLGTSTDELIDTQASVSLIEISKTQFISNIYEEFPRYFENITIDHFQLIPDTNDIRIYTSGGWYGLFDSEEGFVVQLSNLYRVYSEKVPDEKKRTLEYIDVRLDNYVYYK